MPILLMTEDGSIAQLDCEGQKVECEEGQCKPFNENVMHIVHITADTKERQHENIPVVKDFQPQPVHHTVIHYPDVNQKLLRRFEQKVACVGGKCTFVELPA